MEKKGKRLISILLVIVMALGLMTGCSQKKETADDTSSTKSATTASTKEVHLVGYLLGEAPKGMDDVVKAINVKLKKDINTTIEIRYLSWGEYTSKYPLILASGDDVDFIFTSDWCMYSQEAAKNAFYEITEKDLQKYMPKHYKNCNKLAYEQAKINGKMYMITTSTPDRRVSCMVYRKDLAQKYGVDTTKLTKLSDFSDYFKAIKENEPDMYPMYLDSTFDLGAPWQALRYEFGDGIEEVSGTGLFWDIENDKIQLNPIYEEKNAKYLKFCATTMKTWYDAGYVNKDIFSNDVRSKDAFLEGKSAIGFGNSVDMQSVLASAKEKGYDVGIVPFIDAKGHSLSTSYLNNGIGIAASSKNPQRAMMALDLLMEDPSYNMLSYFGIEGKNYVLDANGKVANPEGVTDDTNTYPADAAGFWFNNKDQHPDMASWSDDYINLKNQIESGWLIDNKFSAFSLDNQKISTQVANITQVEQQYQNPLIVGMVDDVDKAMKDLEDKLKAAGVEDVQKEVQSQADAYMKE